MPHVNDPHAIRAILHTDPGWAAYALGDLSPRHWPHCTWLQPTAEAAGLILVYRRFEIPVLFAHGRADELAPLLDELPDDRAFYLSVQPEMLPVLEQRFRFAWIKPMWRMRLQTRNLPARADSPARRLTPHDLGAVQQLYADGVGRGESPDFFSPEMLDDGVFFGLCDKDQLCAVAGTHLVVPEERVAAIGNVYTSFSHRGLGLGAEVTRAVVAELCRQAIPTIILNVAQDNAVAVRLYERLGFVRHVPFCEGLAERLPAPIGATRP